MKATHVPCTLAAVALACPLAATGQTPMGTAFTYQGQLKQGGLKFNGTVDLTFGLYETEAGGTSLTEVQEPNVPVIDGLFTVAVDFGTAEVFNGDARWLEIAVDDPDDPDSLVTLTPRQRITPTPYALQTRGVFVDDYGNVGIGTTGPFGVLHVAGSGDPRIYLENTETDPSQTVSLSFRQGGVTSTRIRAVADDPWNFGRSRLDFITNDTERLTILSNGNVGVGTTSPQARLDVSGPARMIASSTPLDLTNSGTGQDLIIRNTGDNHATIRTTSDRSMSDAHISLWQAVARDSAGNETHYCDFGLLIDSPQDGAETGKFLFRSTNGGGTPSEIMSLTRTHLDGASLTAIFDQLDVGTTTVTGGLEMSNGAPIHFRGGSLDRTRGWIKADDESALFHIQAEDSILMLGCDMPIEIAQAHFVRQTLASEWEYIPVYASDFYQRSSRRFKSNVQALSRQDSQAWLERIDEIRPVRYLYKWERAENEATSPLSQPRVPRLGLIAEELPPELCDPSGEAVDTYALCTAAICAVKELNLRLREQEARIEELERRLAQLEKHR